MKQDVWALFENGCTACAQVVLLMVLTPLCVWVLEELPLYLSGRSVRSVRLSYTHFCTLLWRGLRAGFWPREGMAFAFIMVVFWSLPGVDAFIGTHEGQFFAPMADPLLIGSLLLVGSACLTPVVPVGRYLGTALVLCVADILLVLAAPGADGLVGVHTALQLTPGSGLAGTSICCALALAVVAPLPTEAELTRLFSDDVSVKKRAQRDQNRMLLGLYHMGWLLLVADLLLPVLIGGQGWAGIVGLAARLAMTLALIVGLKLSAVERYPRLLALLIGLGFLIALAGRFAT